MSGRQLVVLAAACLVVPSTARAWGPATHRWIEETAVTLLPDPLRCFFERGRDRLADLAVEPDTVRRAREGRVEAVRHFIDLDLYGEPPFASLPRSYRTAIRRFGRRTVTERGTLPWVILADYSALRRELRRGDWGKALSTAGLAGHYLADAFMPLHVTSNHDGRKSGAAGIHETIERDLVDARISAYGDAARVRLEPARRRRFKGASVFAILIDSDRDVPALFQAERQARDAGRPGSAAYLDALDLRLRGILTARVAAATSTLASYWLSAWQQAGEPPGPCAAIR